jgi:hypothetical protein
MFYCHSDNRRTITLASLSGWARIAGVSPDGPGPILPHWRISTPSLAGSTSNPHVVPTPSGADDVPDPSGVGLRLRRPRTRHRQLFAGAHLPKPDGHLDIGKPEIAMRDLAGHVQVSSRTTQVVFR